MNFAEIEAWAIRVLERVENHQPLEDARVELKREWIDPKKAARRIAGHANAARGNPILWLVGVDEELGPVDIEREEFSNWLAKVQAEFDGLSPTVTNLIVPTRVPSCSIVALLFETARAPYVVKTRLSGGVTHEVPWREGNGTRSALRYDLLSILQPIRLQPDIELLKWHARAQVQHCGPGEHDYNLHWRFVLSCYITPRSNDRLVIPRHRCGGWFEVNPHVSKTEIYDIRLLSPDSPELADVSAVFLPHPHESLLAQSFTIRNTTNESIIDGPGRVEVVCTAASQISQFKEGEELWLDFSLAPVPDYPAVHQRARFWCFEIQNGLSFWSAVPPHVLNRQAIDQ